MPTFSSSLTFQNSSLISFRRIRDNDLEFLRALYATTREDEMALVDWSEEQKRDFLTMQFEAQHKHYQEHYPDAAFDIIQLDGVDIGRVYLDRRDSEFRLIDIALVPQMRNRGIGTLLMNNLIGEAREAGLPVTIHVENFNPALRWYTRLGFREVETNGVYFFMKWEPHYA